jgi:hypothetical protein
MTAIAHCGANQGTTYGYQQHRKANETACADCKAAWADYIKEYRARRPQVVAEDHRQKLLRDKALRLLAQAHRAEFERIYRDVIIEASEARRAMRTEQDGAAA